MRYSNAVFRRAQGLTLIELMIVISIVTILMLIVVPSMRSFIEESHQASTRDLLVDTVYRTQQEAIRSNLSAYICPSATGTKCDSGWTTGGGWIAYLDLDRNNKYSTDDSIIVAQPAISAKSIKSSEVNIRFLPTGHATEATISVCSHEATIEDRQISVNRVGRVEYAAPSTAYCS